MEEKQTNLAVAADVKTKKELLELARSIGPEICLLKTHIDIIEDFDSDLIEQLQELAQKHNFLLVEDRKFCDIGSTVQAQYAGGIYKIAQWADLVIAHAIAGPGIIQGIQRATENKERGILLIAHMSSTENLIDENYAKKVTAMATQHKDFVVGCICKKACLSDPGMVHLTPGVNLYAKGDSLGQQFNTPEKAIIENGTDIIIVGRGIYQTEYPHAAAQQYRQAAWHAYQNRLTNYRAGCAKDRQLG